MKAKQKTPPPEPAEKCECCKQQRMFMFVVETVNGWQTQCNRCWRDRA